MMTMVTGAYLEGKNVGNVIAGYLAGNKTICRDEARYQIVRGCATSGRGNVSTSNDWFGATLATYGLRPARISDLGFFVFW